MKDHWTRRRDDAAIDKGGPTRQLFSQFWENMAEIKVEFKKDSQKMRELDSVQQWTKIWKHSLKSIQN
jgi:hypothetical protein